MGLSLDLSFGGRGSVFLKLSFLGVGCFYFEFLGDYFFIKGIFLKFFFLFCGGGLLIFV